MISTINHLILTTAWLFEAFSFMPGAGQNTEMPYWLEGHWLHMQTPDTVRSGEVWRISPAGILTGLGYEIHHQDTVFIERLQIAHAQGSVHYRVEVSHNPTPVEFILVNFGYDKWVFENPEHDFPNSIAYIRNGPGYMTCIIEGNGRSKAFHFEKIQ